MDIRSYLRPGLLVFVVGIALLFTSCRDKAVGSLVVHTTAGYVKGVKENGIAVYKGIPYAAPPVGALRFKAPQAHQPWSDTLVADKFGHVATQFSSGAKMVTGSEDCLTLNVYAPHADTKLPVVVWVHGGGMVFGSGKEYNGHAFADNDSIVTITINYRLGVFGFMYLGDVGGDYTSSGNNGLLDCIMALQWVHDNIAAFGGDPNRVTIMGESAGAKLTSALLVTPRAKGLFSQYIGESGAMQSIRSIATARNARKLFLQQLGLGENDAAKILTMNADTLIRAQSILCQGAAGLMFFGPVTDSAVITEDAYQYIAEKKQGDIRALMGTNKAEATLFMWTDKRLKEPDEMILKLLFGDNYFLVYKRYMEELKSLPQQQATAEVLTQYMYQMHTYRLANALTTSGTPVWMYRFDYDKGPLGACHASELAFVWFQLTVPPKKEFFSRVDTALATAMHSSWAAFIKHGNPSVAGLPAWSSYNSTGRKVMALNTQSQLIKMDTVYDDAAFPADAFVLSGE